MQTEAIILNVKPFLEKDLIVEMFTKQAGRVRVFAKYAQSSKPRFGGLLNTFNWVSVILIERKGSFTIRQIQSIDPFNKMKNKYSHLSIGYRIIEVVRSTTQMRLENEQLFDLTVTAFGDLNQGHLESDYLKRFYYLLLKNEGIIDEEMNLTEKDYEKMIESYTGIKLKGKL